MLCGLSWWLPERLNAAEPANPKASPQTRKILDYFYSLKSAQNEKRLLTGQFTDFGRGARLGIMTNIFSKTGQWPALLGADYADFGRGGITCQAPNQAAIAYWKQGGLVTITPSGPFNARRAQSGS